ncbi:MAG: CRTAC1 family protein [Xanthomonadales bacterium]|nr:CRTAC1 family protein [Xanthomonadales bacterium]
MRNDPDNHATDQVIGVAFRRSLWTLLLVALLVGAFLLADRFFRTESPAVEAPSTAPVQSGAVERAPAVMFRDVTRQAGIDFEHVTGAYGDKLLPETMGSGAAFFDYDNDGDSDLLLVNGDDWPGRGLADRARPTPALYRNDGTGVFEDVTREAGLDLPIYGMGVAVGDYDNDGDADVYLTALGRNLLLRNDDGRFHDVSGETGVEGAADAWSTSAAFVDVDNDGDLDLFVGNYVRWSPELDFEVDFRLTGIGRAYGPPSAYEGFHNYLFRNDGGGRFSDVSEASGIHVLNPATGRPMGKALAVVPVDIDRDGWIDLLVANDTVQNFLYRNRGDGSFEEQGALLGVAFDRDGKATGAMGADAAHFRNDGDLGIAIGNFANEMTSLYVTQAAAPPFTDEAIVEGIGSVSRRALTFGLFFFDFDLDGRLDLLQANGHLEEEINKVQSSQQFKQAAQLFWNCGCRSGFLPQPAEAVGDLATPLVGRGAAYADIDGDGDLDVLITQNGGPPLLLRNDLALGHHWLRVKLVGQAVNRDAIGARVELRTGDRLQRQQLMPSRSYLSQVEPVLTFGLGTADRIDELTVVWPDGSRQPVTPPAIDTTAVIIQQP